MSHNPWPFVIVAIGSLGFLANSMAQNNNRFDNFLATDEADQPFARGESPFAVRLADPSDVRNRPDELQSPFGKSDQVRSNSASDLSESWDSFEQRNSSLQDENLGTSRTKRVGGRPPEFRRDDEQATAKIRAVRATRQLPSHATSEFVPVRPEETRVAQGPGTSENQPLFGNRRNRGLSAQPASPVNSGAIRPNNAITRQDERDALFDQDFKSKHTSLLRENDSDLITNLGTKSSAAFNPIKEKTTDGQQNPLGAALEKGKQKLEGALDTASQQRSVPFWLTLGLFFSLPANLFFGWIAMSMHSRYQDLLEDMNVSESRLDRESRRRRAEPREDRRPRRTRDSEEEAFLHGGIEV